ncbi:DNA polymerase III subunit gamma/tau [Halomonas binhaiensis]|uniref:DNA polymerase III subunit gamma/tau n=1 Tax=Halomonas binhaiensis TaxID=2562282 RepID=A0A5C1NHR8_9GAMM|nr:DNA polymerase III subunit gamma/tau [Halomonas binhaiensis]QEM81259.1 DNA polymerase III subunit gamma/tau [Halomonas binhaiensis]
MSYQVLARKWRPRTFHELVGQEHVQRALVNALDQGRLHHAYLFTGTRGVGKTTLARILAKCLNCTAGGHGDEGITSNPCGTCDACVSIDQGRFVDLIEVDAASRTKVEDTRELLDNVQYAPTQGRYKVYLIDEVHMLSTSSFNALLKTLEEPPPHVKFLLATTDPQKLPATVLSRCLQFTLKHMPPERIVGHLSKVLEAENVPFEESALWLLGKAAAGSMRDAMSLTDQAIAFGQGEVRHADVAAMLGTLDHRHVLALVEALSDVDAARVLQEVAKLAEQGPDFAAVLDDLTAILHRLAIGQMVPQALDNGHGDRETLLALSARFTAEDIQLYYQIGVQGRADMAHAPDLRTALEMTLLRMLAFRPQGVPKPARTPLPLRAAPEQQGSVEQSSAGTAVEGATGTAVEGATGTAVEGSTGTAVEDSAPEPQPEAATRSEPPPWEGGAAEDPSPGAEMCETEASSAENTVAATSQTLPHEPSPMSQSSPGLAEPVSGEPGPDEPAPAEPPPWEEAALDNAQEPEGVAAVGSANVASPDVPNTPDLNPAASSDVTAAPAAADVEPVVESVTESSAPVDTVSDTSTVADTTPVIDDRSASEARAGVENGIEGRLNHAVWLASFDTLGLSGLTRNLAAHCVVGEDDGQSVQMLLDPSQAAMNAEVHITRIRDALEAAGYPRRLDIEVCELPGDVETPRQMAERLAAERHAQAVESLKRDPHIQQMQQTFGARLVESTVKPLEPENGR